MKITKEVLISAIGREPVDDDLERCNCPDAGEPIHTCCGWNTERNLPQYFIGPLEAEERSKK